MSAKQNDTWLSYLTRPAKIVKFVCGVALVQISTLATRQATTRHAWTFTLRWYIAI